MLKLIYKLNYLFKWHVQEWTNLKNTSDLENATPPRDSTSIEMLTVKLLPSGPDPFPYQR